MSPAQAVIRRGPQAVGRTALALAAAAGLLMVAAMQTHGAVSWTTGIMAAALGVAAAWLVESFSTLALFRNIARRDQVPDRYIRASRGCELVAVGCLLTAFLWTYGPGQVGLVYGAIAALFASSYWYGVGEIARD